MKFTKRNLFPIFFAVIVFSISGCDLLNKPEPEIPAMNAANEQKDVAPAPENTPPVKTDAGGGPCANKYFPVSDGYTRRYKVTSSKESDEYTYKISYQAVANSFTETQSLKFGKAAALNNDWNCLTEGLQTASFAQITGVSRVGMTLKSKKASGVTLPKDSDWQIGKKWISEYELGGTFDIKAVKGDVTGKVVLDHEITAMDEKITVPAGDYTVARVETKLTMNASFRGMTIPSETLKRISWYAPGVGLVKYDVKGKMGTMLMEYTGK